MSSEMISLLYCSRAEAGDAEASKAVITNILQVSRSNNARDGLTGALMFTNGNFAQILEGPADAVERTFARVRHDPRHRDVVVLAKLPLQERSFADWSMALSVNDLVANEVAPGVFRRAFAEQGEAVGLEVRDLIQKGISAVQIW